MGVMLVDKDKALLKVVCDGKNAVLVGLQFRFLELKDEERVEDGGVRVVEKARAAAAASLRL